MPKKKTALVQRKELLDEYINDCDGIQVAEWTAPHIRGPIIISLYAEKGGVGKSTASSSLAWTLAAAGKRVLMIDCDGQRSLSKWILDQQLADNQTLQGFIDERAAAGHAEREQLRSAFAAEHPDDQIPVHLLEPLYTLRDQLVEARESADEVRAAVPLPVPNRPNLFLLAGHSRIHDEDRHLNIQEGLSLANGGGVTLTGAPYHAIMATARAINADIVLLDLNPISSTLNRCLVMSSHYLLIPGIPDFSTKEMLTEMRDILPRWLDEWTKLRPLAAKTRHHRLPPHLPKFLGYMLIRYQARVYGPMRSGVTQDSLALNEREWLVRVEQAADMLQERLSPLGMALDRSIYVNTGRSTCVAMIRDFFQLGDLSGHFHVPTNFLRRQHLVKLKRNRRTGQLEETPTKSPELDDLQLRVHMFFLIFKAIADNIFRLIREDGVGAVAAPMPLPPAGVPNRDAALAALFHQYPAWCRQVFALPSLQLVDDRAELQGLEAAVAAANMTLRPDELTRGMSATDGSCQFLAIVDQELLHQGIVDAPIGTRMARACELRRLVVNRIRNTPNMLGAVVGNVERYLKDSEWGDHVTLMALALELNVRVCLHSSRHPQNNFNDDDATLPVYHIGHVYETHYRSVVGRGALGDPSSASGSGSGSVAPKLSAKLEASSLGDDDIDDDDMEGTKVIMSESDEEEEEKEIKNKHKKRKSAK